MSKFPIAEQIRHGRPIEVPTWWPQEDVLNGSIDWRDLLKDVPLFDVSVAADLYWHGKKDYYSLAEDFGPLRPPYPAMWMEWVIPDDFVIDSGPKDSHFLAGCRHAAFLHTQEFHPYTEDAPLLSIQLDMEGYTAIAGHLLTQVPGDDRILYVPIVNVIAVDNQTGQYMPHSQVAAGDKDVLTVLKQELPEDRFKSVTNIDLNVAYMALNLINCRNVTTPQTGVAFARTGREKRQRVPVTRYHTIQLPGMSQRPGKGSRRTRAEEAIMARHRVRGHFKTYTAEAPLMGKHVGTYWWGWQVRGSRKHGEVISDYEFKEAL